MDEGRLFGRGLSFPPRIGGDGRFAWSAGSANVSENIRVLLMTDPGERIMLPEFGGRLRQFLFEPNTPTTRRLIADQIESALKRWEPRISLAGVDVHEDPEDARAAIAHVRYTLIANRTASQLTLRVRLAS